MTTARESKVGGARQACKKCVDTVARGIVGRVQGETMVREVPSTVRRLLAAFILAVASNPAGAAIDLNGPWSLDIAWGSFPPGGCVVTVAQTGSALEISGCVSLSGTIDPDGGALAASGSASGCPSLSISGTAALDSSGFSGTIECDILDGTFVATRCGNDVLDPGEDCDEGRHKLSSSSDPCCSDTCTAAAVGTPCDDAETCRAPLCNAAGQCRDASTAAGTPCESDDNVCTDDRCDGLGGCAHVPNAASCDDGNFCTTDRCSGGSCVGTCSLCCDAAAGCTPAPGTACKGPATPASSLKLKLDPSGVGKQNVTWVLKKGDATSLGDLGDPRGTTAYAFCAYRPRPPLGLHDLLVRADVPAAAYCLQSTGAYAPCWRDAAGLGFDFKNQRPENPDQPHDGVRSMSLRTGGAGRTRMKVKAVGSRLRTQVYSGSDPVIGQLRASNGECWEAGFVDARKDRFTFVGPHALLDYRANRASPSGAFLEH
jgi:hypothetical protein